jgi:hypothetical protein
VSDHALFTLLGIAGLATTFSGFSGVVAVFGGRALGNWAPEERTRMINLLILSLAACFFSFVPIVEELLNFSETIIWTSSSLFLGIFSGVYFIYALCTTQKLLTIRKGKLVQWVRIAFMTFLPGSTLLQFMNVFELGVKRDAGPLIAGLVLNLTLAGIQFAYLVLVPVKLKEKA